MSNPGPRQIGRLILAERTRRGMTQAAVGEAAGLSPCYVGQIENGYRPPLGVLRIVGDVIGQRPKLQTEGKTIGQRLRAERLRAGLTIWRIERSMAADRSWLAVLERGLRKPFPGEVFRYLQAVQGKRVPMRRLGAGELVEPDKRLVEIARRLVSVEKMLARYQAADLEPPDSLILERVGLRDGAAMYAVLVSKDEQRRETLAGRIRRGKRGGWYWRAKFKVGEANRRRVRHLMQSGLLDRPKFQTG